MTSFEAFGGSSVLFSHFESTSLRVYESSIVVTMECKRDYWCRVVSSHYERVDGCARLASGKIKKIEKKYRVLMKNS